MKAFGRWLLAGMAILLGTSAHAAALDPVLATTDLGVIRRSDLEAWRPLIESRHRELRRLKDTPDAAERFLLEEIALVDIAIAEGGRFVDRETRMNLWWEIWGKTIRARYFKEIVVPQIRIDESEIRKIFEDNPAGFRKAEAAALFEIFRWAPTDLPELRRRARAQLEELRGSIGTIEEFKEAAREVSDATSALNDGSIGILFRDRVGPKLEKVLFDHPTGMTEIVETGQGLYLFWVTRRLPPKINSFADVRDGIEKQLRRMAFDRQEEIDRERLLDQHIVVRHPTESVAVSIDGIAFDREELGLQHDDDDDALERRILSMLFTDELEKLGLCPPEDPVLEFRMALASKAFNLLVDRARKTGNPQSTPRREAAPKSDRRIELFSFDMLTVEGHPESFFELFRIRYELGEKIGLEAVKERLRSETGIDADVSTYTAVGVPDVAPMGPEVYRTLTRGLEPGRSSRPLEIDGRIVMLFLHERKDDVAASRTASINRAERRVLEDLIRQTRQQLLREHGFSLRASPAD